MLLFDNYTPMLEGHTLADPKSDYRTAEKFGFFRISGQAFYAPDKRYILRSDILSAEASWGAAHVTGCCAGGVPTPRLVIVTPEKKFPFLCDKEAMTQKMADMLNGKA